MVMFDVFSPVYCVKLLWRVVLIILSCGAVFSPVILRAIPAWCGCDVLACGCFIFITSLSLGHIFFVSTCGVCSV